LRAWDAEAVDDERPYLGTAQFYEQHRRRLSEEFVRLLVERVGLGGPDRVLDLGSGPARVARQLAPFVGEVVAVDPEPGMAEEGRRRAAAEDLRNVHCVVGRSRGVGALAVLGPFRAVAIATAFHWMARQDEVLDGLERFVSDAVVLINHELGPPPGVAWIADLDALLQLFVADAPRGWHPSGRHDPFPEILARSPFPVVEKLRHEYELEEQLTLEWQIGFRYSLSWVLQQLGD
jgi:ubiquinone/menaquinone biosynthesis C-methylase UbiE